MNEISFSPNESRRFDITIYRGQIDEINVDNLRKLIFEKQIDILIVRVPHDNKSLHYKLTNIGFNCLHADSLVEYSKDISNSLIPNIKNNLEFELITRENSCLLEKMIPIIFQNYQNHYVSNPYLDREKILQGYVEFAISHATNFLENKIAWYVKKNGRMAGFSACSYNEDNKECEGVLYGVMPDFTRQKFIQICCAIPSLILLIRVLLK